MACKLREWCRQSFLLRAVLRQRDRTPCTVPHAVADTAVAIPLRWLGFIAKVLLPAALFTISVLAATANPARAQTSSSKIAVDLQAVISASTTPKLSWVKDVSGVRYLKALIVSDGNDPDMVALRADILAKGGSVYFNYVSVDALSVLLPAPRVAEIAARDDVQSISPNRLTARTMSTLEYTTGALASSVRTYSNATSYTGLDGTGVGIAVLDSGIDKYHYNMLAADNKTLRVKKAVDFQKAGDAASSA